MSDQPDDASAQTIAAPSIALPKGGGALRGINEKFATNPVTGSASLSVPVPTSPGRSRFEPQLELSYDSGTGNGPFGFGWSLSVPAITRRTDKGLPRYLDAVDSDVFMLAGAEDLVPVYRTQADGSFVRDAADRLVIHEDERDGYRVRRYRPRVEGLFARIERWTKTGSPGDVHWRSISKDNTLTIYGAGAESRIADPLDPSRIFTWLISESRDDRGNGAIYRYKAEDGTGVDERQAHERNRGPRDDVRRTSNRYLKYVRYGNRGSLLVDGTRPIDVPQQVDPDWMFEVVFDYGEHDDETPKPDDPGDWVSRPDAFSSYRAGFEVRTSRLCRRILMFHHFPADAAVGDDCLVRSLDLTYSDALDPSAVPSPVYTFLRAARQTGYRRSQGTYAHRSLPPLELEYSEPAVQHDVETLDPESLENLPIGLDGSAYRWTDLHGEGLPGILTEQTGAWFYKRNVSALPVTMPDGRRRVEARFEPLETVSIRPTAALADGADFMDLAGDGQPDLVVLNGPTPGLFEHDDAEGWARFRPFTSRLNRDLRDPNTKLVDLDGDGHADVLVTEDGAFVWHQSLAEAGFGPAQRVPHPLDEEAAPRIVFGDGTQGIYLADLSGDGLADIARVRNGEVCYWPSLGYGRFGAKVTMDNAPWFDEPDQFDPRRLRLADIDGSGTTDLIYLGRDGVRLYFNQAGNGWAAPQPLEAFPRIDDTTSITAIDLLGRGSTCLVWSSPLAGDATRPMRYVNLMGDRKPHLLVRTVNNLGRETRIAYAPSTAFYLRDRLRGRPWATRLPFPVHAVERVETYDHVGRNRFVTQYAYHDGCFDGEEREFRGFGMVEQWDTEQFAALTSTGMLPVGDNDDGGSHVPPVHTKTWFHTGTLDRPRGAVRDEQFREPGLSDAEAAALLLPDTVVPPGLTATEEREAARALKGAVLRQEVYADDAGPGASAAELTRARTPYTVTERSFGIRVVQPRGGNRHAVVFRHEREAIVYQYERDATDPRVQHTLTLEVDGYNNVLKQADVAYGRRPTVRAVDAAGRVQQVPNPGLAELAVRDRPKQTTMLATYTERRVTNAVDSADEHRNPLPCEAVAFELTGYPAGAPAGRLRREDLVEADPAAPGRLRHKFANQVSYEAAASGPQCRRAVEWMRTLYRADDLTGLLPLGEVQSLGLSGERYHLAFTAGLISDVFQRPRAGGTPEVLIPNPATVLGGSAGDRGGYVAGDALKADGRFPAGDPAGQWWIPSGRSFYSPVPAPAATELDVARRHFFLIRRYRDPFGHDTHVTFDSGNDLLMVETLDALGNRVTVDANDYRVLEPRLVSDPNRNRTEVTFDALGMVVASAVMGKPAPATPEGDTLAGLTEDLTQAQLDALINAPDPASLAPALLADATSRIVYDLDRFRRSQQAHPSDPTRWEPVSAATLTRETHSGAALPPHGLRVQLSFAYSDGFGREIQTKACAEAGPVSAGGPAHDPRWVVTGWTVFNNKGNPVRRYEPFFSATHRFEFGVTVGVSSVLFYDPATRVVATLRANDTYEKVRFGAWQRTSYDVNDTCAPRNEQTGDPRTDPDIGGLVARHFESLPDGWETWFDQRIDGALGARERTAAVRAAAHADTPATVHADALGRPFLTVARNRVVCAGHDLDGTQETFITRTDLDIEGNTRSARDARDRVVMAHVYDMLGHCIHRTTLDAGERWMLDDVSGKSIRLWDSRGHRVTNTYDALRRQIAQTVRGTTADSDPRTLNRDVVVEQVEYGEVLANAEQLNLRTRIYRHFDSVGIAISARLDANGDPTAAYDFRGNQLHSSRRLVSDYDTIADWSLDPPLEDEIFVTTTLYDALNRTTQVIAPHSSQGGAGYAVIQPQFNAGNLLERVDVWLDRAQEPAALLDPVAELPSPVGVRNVDYDAKGRRARIGYKNGATTFSTYDPLTFRLTRVYTRRGAAFTDDCENATPPPATVAAPDEPPAVRTCGIQNLSYTYDAVGNVTHIADAAQQTIFFRNRLVEPSGDYIYDAVYRLIQATGREHLGQGGARLPYSNDDAGRVGVPSSDGAGLFAPGDGDAMATYVERYVYDAVGNFLEMQHRGSDATQAGWTRTFDYQHQSPFAATDRSNRVTSSTVTSSDGSITEPCGHDPHGNVVRLSHLGGGAAAPNMVWDYADRLRRVELGGGGTAFHVYDAGGRRVRKVWRKAPGLIEERIYLGGVEIQRRHPGPIGPATATLERVTLHLVDNKQSIAMVETRTVDSAGNDPAPAQLVRYQHSNHVGSAALELDAQARIITYEEYAPYGGSTYQAVRSQTETPKRYRFSGKERDEETGLYYHGARYYAPWLGVWTACDPAGERGSHNAYGYCAQNPLGFVDPDGAAPLPARGLALIDDARNLLFGPRTHLDRGSNQAILLEAQGGGMVKEQAARYYNHAQSAQQDIIEAQRLSLEMDAYAGRTAGLSEEARTRLTTLSNQLYDATLTTEATLETAQDLVDSGFGERFKGATFDTGRLVTEQLADMAAEHGTPATLLPPNAPQYAGVLETIETLPTRARGPLSVTASMGVAGAIDDFLASSKVLRFTEAVGEKASSAGRWLAVKGAALMEAGAKLARYVQYGLALHGGEEAVKSLLSREKNERLNVYYSVRDEPNAGEQLLFQGAATGIGLVDAFAVDVKAGWGDLEYGASAAETYMDYGMSPAQRDFTEWARIELGLVPDRRQ